MSKRYRQSQIINNVRRESASIIPSANEPKRNQNTSVTSEQLISLDTKQISVFEKKNLFYLPL